MSVIERAHAEIAKAVATVTAEGMRSKLNIKTLEDARRIRRRAQTILRRVQRRPAWDREPLELQSAQDFLAAAWSIEREFTAG